MQKINPLSCYHNTNKADCQYKILFITVLLRKIRNLHNKNLCTGSLLLYISIIYTLFQKYGRDHSSFPQKISCTGVKYMALHRCKALYQAHAL